jgi:hypothetical protein
LVDGSRRLKIETGEKPVLRESGGKVELLVPVRFKDNKSSFVIEYSW